MPDVREELKFLYRLDSKYCMKLLAYEINMSLVVTMLIELCPFSVEDLRTAKDRRETTRSRLLGQSNRTYKRLWSVMQSVNRVSFVWRAYYFPVCRSAIRMWTGQCASGPIPEAADFKSQLE